MQSPNNGGEWGIFGGAFNPVHYGHLTLARDICEARQSDGILLVPSYIPPRKQSVDLASYEDRLEMLRRATEGDDRLLTSTIESESDSPGYTLLTVRALKKRYPTASFYFIIGADLLSEFATWYEAGEIIKEVRVVAGSRPGAAVTIPANLPADRFQVINTSMVDLASRDIRARIREGISAEALAQLVPKPVAEYILERRLYRG